MKTQISVTDNKRNPDTDGKHRNNQWIKGEILDLQGKQAKALNGFRQVSCPPGVAHPAHLLYGQYQTHYTENPRNTENPEYLYGKHGTQVTTGYISNPGKKCPLYGFNPTGGQIPVKSIETLLENKT